LARLQEDYGFHPIQPEAFIRDLNQNLEDILT
jgi:hypothetical protein